MFSYYPSYQTYSPYDARYAQAVAEERAARAQYAAALRAQEEARNRAARARLAQQAYASPYNSYLLGDYDDDDEDYPAYLTRPSRPASSYTSAYGLSPQQRVALAQLERERERQRLVELEEERRRQVAAEEERRRKLVEEEMQRRREEEEEVNRRRQAAFEQLYRNFGMRTPREQSDMNTARRARTTSPPNRRPSPPAESVRIPIEEPATSKVSDAERIAAVEKIAAFYHTHASRRKALQTINDVHSRFESLKNAFTLPEQLDYQGASHNEHISVDTSSLALPSIIEEEPYTPEDEDAPMSTTPKLAYTARNAPLHQYDEELNRLLGKLDSVESGGDRVVREKRRDMVREVEKEAQRVERWMDAVWKGYQEAQSKVQEDAAMEEAAEEVVSAEEAPETAPVDEVSEPQPDIPQPMDVDASSPSPATIDITTPAPVVQPIESSVEPEEPQASSSSEVLSPTTADEPLIEETEDTIAVSPVLIPHAVPAFVAADPTPLPSIHEEHDDEDEQAVLVALSDSEHEEQQPTSSPEVLSSAAPLTRTDLEPLPQLQSQSPSSCAQEVMSVAEKGGMVADDFVMC